MGPLMIAGAATGLAGLIGGAISNKRDREYEIPGHMDRWGNVGRSMQDALAGRTGQFTFG